MNLIERIAEKERLANSLRQAWKDVLLEVEQLKESRSDCDHEFSKPLKWYEHEGGICTICGIGQLYSECQKIGKKYSVTT